MPKKKVTLLCRLKRPHCTKPLEVYKETETLSPAVKAEKEERFYAEKSVQTEL